MGGLECAEVDSVRGETEYFGPKSEPAPQDSLSAAGRQEIIAERHAGTLRSLRVADWVHREFTDWFTCRETGWVPGRLVGWPG